MPSTGPRDASLILRDGTTDLSGDETLTLTLRGGNSLVMALAVMILIPGAPGAETFTWRVRFTDTGKQHSITPTTVHTAGTDSVPVTYVIPLPITDAEALEVFLDVSSTGDWGAVQVWLEHVSNAVTPDAA